MRRTHRETDRQRDRQTERQTDRQTEVQRWTKTVLNGWILAYVSIPYTELTLHGETRWETQNIFKAHKGNVSWFLRVERNRLTGCRYFTRNKKINISAEHTVWFSCQLFDEDRPQGGAMDPWTHSPPPFDCGHVGLWGRWPPCYHPLKQWTMKDDCCNK